MKAYKIRICSDESEDFLREIEILGDQNFLDLHDFIVEICDLNGNDLASFYTCDNEWNKLSEISLLDMTIDEKNANKDEEDEDFAALPIKVMEDTPIAEIIKKSGQRLLYEYDFLEPVILFLQCIDIEETESDEYPVCVYQEGELDYRGGMADDFISEKMDDLDFADDDSFDDEIEDEFNDLMEGDYDDDGY